MGTEADKPQAEKQRANPVPLMFALLAFALAIYAIHTRLDHVSMHLVYARFSGLCIPWCLVCSRFEMGVPQSSLTTLGQYLFITIACYLKKDLPC